MIEMLRKQFYKYSRIVGKIGMPVNNAALYSNTHNAKELISL